MSLAGEKSVSRINLYLLYSSIMFSIAILYDPAAEECSELGLLPLLLLTPATTVRPL